MTKSLLVLLAIALLGLGATACGSDSKSTSSSQAASTDAATKSSSTSAVTGSNDADDGDILNKHDENDDGEIVQYGSAANPADKQAVTAFITQFYKAAEADEGAALCSLIVSKLAKNIPKSFSQPSVPSYERGSTCAQIMTKLYKYRHPRISTEAAGYQVTGVRVNGNNGYALLSFTKMREPRFIYLEREGGSWKMAEELIDSPYP